MTSKIEPMSDDTWTSLRHWGRHYRDGTTFSARMFSLRIREAVAEGASWGEIASAAQVAIPTARRHAERYSNT